MARKPKSKKPLEVDTLTHEAARRRNIPTAEMQPVMQEDDLAPRELRYPRNTDLDPQLVWRGKDEQDWSDLVVQAPPLYIQEKVHPKVVIDDLLRGSRERRAEADAATDAPDLFADFNGLRDSEAKYEFYAHDQHWSNRMILGDALQTMASLAEREGLRGKVQCIYIDPPYGIRFNSNFQWSTTTRDVKDGKADHISREPEQVKAFRDTWRDGIHSYLTYLRDRLTVARDLLSDSGSIFVQIGDENVHRVRGLLDEIFGEENFVTEIKFQKTGSSTGKHIQNFFDTILWFFKEKGAGKSRVIKNQFGLGDLRSDITPWLCEEAFSYRKLTKAEMASDFNREGLRIFAPGPINSQHPSETRTVPLEFQGEKYAPPRNRQWTYDPKVEMVRLGRANFLLKYGNTLRVKMYRSDKDFNPVSNVWTDTQLGGVSSNRVYVVQTAEKVIQRCILMTTDPGDLVLDPTCGSGTTAYVAEQWGRRWITIDTSRVALALARARLMGARYPWYLLADTPEGQQKEGEVTGKPPSEAETHGDIRQGFVYERVPHITLKAIANNAEIDVIWDEFQETLEPLRAKLNEILEADFEEWEIPREPETPWDDKFAKLHSIAVDEKKSTKVRQDAVDKLNAEWDWDYTLDTLPKRPVDIWAEYWPEAVPIHAQWWEARIERQRRIDASIARSADTEYLYDRPYTDNARIRVAGPFTVESLSPHRVLPMDQDDELVGLLDAREGEGGRERAGLPRSEEETDFAQMVLDHLKSAGVQQAHREDRITFSSISGWPGYLVSGEGRFMEVEREKRAAIFIGPEYGTVTRPDLAAAAREAAEAGFDVLIACAFNFDAQSTELDQMGRLQVLKARMNADLHMADELKNTGAGNLFVVFGEPDIDIEAVAGDGGGGDRIRVRINGVDVFDPQKGEVRSGGPDSIAAWFIDTDYNEESFFVRHAYFLGASDPYKALKTSLKAEIDEEAWASLYSDVSRPFAKPATGRIAVKVINHLGDEVMKVFGVG